MEIIVIVATQVVPVVTLLQIQIVTLVNKDTF